MKYIQNIEHCIKVSRKELMEKLKLGTPEFLLDIDIRINDEDELVIEWTSKTEEKK